MRAWGKNNTAFSRPVMSFDRLPARQLPGLGKRVPGGVQTRVQPSALWIDADRDLAGRQRL